MTGEHRRKKESRLTEAERKVLLHFAKHGPKTGYDLFRKDYVISSSTWHQVKRSLEGPVLIGELDYLKSGVGEATEDHEMAEAQRKYRALQIDKSRSRPFWLTSFGVGEALGLGADAKRMLSIMNENGIEDQHSRAILDMAVAGGRDWAMQTFDQDVADSFESGFWTIRLPKHPHSRYEVLAAIKSHPKVAKSIGEQFLREAKWKSDMGQLFQSEAAWETYAERLRQKAKDPIVNLMLMLQESKGMARVSAIDVLRKFGKSNEEAEVVIQDLQRNGSIYEPRPSFLKSMGLWSDWSELTEQY